jgi:predicted Zn-dependent protease
MHRKLSLILGLIVLAACATVPYTNRKQFNLISPQEEAQLGEQAYAEVLQKNKLTQNAEWQRRLQEIGRRIAAAANQPDFKWEFNVLQGKDVNAFCLPGGKVAFWDGIMPICGTDDAVAVVMGHEVSHALLQHGNERMSAQLGTEVVGTGLQVALSSKPVETQNAFLTAFGVGSQVGLLLPFSRNQESDADEWGLKFAAMAGYNPEEAISLWERMEKAGSGQKPPEFLSTHPSEGKRIEHLKQVMPDAMKLYKPAK